MPVCEINICVVTCDRPHYLHRLLTELERYESNLFMQLCCKLLIVDNSTTNSSGVIYQRSTQRNALPLKYIRAHKKGLAIARNVAIDYSITNSKYLCFIDDDELPTNEWLRELVQIQKETNADCVYGPVYPVLPPDAPAWIKRGRFFDPPLFDENNPAISAGAGNMMISCAFLKKTGLRFDERFNLSGGEDSFFLLQGQKKHGMKIIGAKQAIVWEPVDPARLNPGWIVRRKFRIGNGLALFETFGKTPFYVKVIRGFKGFARILMGIAIMPCGLLLGKHIAVKGVVMMAFGAGMLSGICGYVYKEYAQK